ncbi:MAG: enterochelin esterase, partial [Gaiellaceae bacterium]
MEPWARELEGRIEEHALKSELLRGNPLGDPHVRPLWVYVPPAYDAEPDLRVPSIYLIQGFTGQV